MPAGEPTEKKPLQTGFCYSEIAVGFLRYVDDWNFTIIDAKTKYYFKADSVRKYTDKDLFELYLHEIDTPVRIVDQFLNGATI